MDKRFYDNERLLRADAEQNPNVSELCRNIGISRTHYYTVIQGISASPTVLSKVCAALKVPYAEVIRTEPVEAA